MDEKGVDDDNGDDYDIIKRVLDNQGNYYDVLNVSKYATNEEISKQYRILAKKIHPDKNSSQQAEEAFKVVCKAYEVLSDASKRAQYNLQILLGALSDHLRKQEEEEMEQLFAQGTFWSKGCGKCLLRLSSISCGARQKEFLVAVLVIIISVCLFYAWNFDLNSSTSYDHSQSYSLKKNKVFQKEMTTKAFKVLYYVKENVEYSKDAMKILEKWVVEKHKKELESQCSSDKLWPWRQGSKSEACRKLKRMKNGFDLYDF